MKVPPGKGCVCLTQGWAEIFIGREDLEGAKEMFGSVLLAVIHGFPERIENLPLQGPASHAPPPPFGTPLRSGSAGRNERRPAPHSRSILRRSALPITETELSAMAAAAMIGDSVQPKNG